MAHLSVIIPDELMVSLKNRLNNLKSTGIRKGDIKEFIIAAIQEKLDNITPKDRGHLLLQKEIDELKAENLRLNSAENPAFRQLVKAYRDTENLLRNYERSATFSIKPEDTQEVFEILCAIPFDIALSQDSEPPNRRHPAIEAMIQQLKEIIDKEE